MTDQDSQEHLTHSQQDLELLFRQGKLRRSLSEKEQQERLQQDLKAVQQRNVSQAEMLSIIEHFGATQFTEALPIIETLLQDEDPLIREAALKSLTRSFSLERHWETARRFVLDETDFPLIDRQAGITALADLKRQTGDQKTLALLAAVVCDATENRITRKWAYAAMITVRAGRSLQQSLIQDERFVLERHADWPMVQAYLDTEGRTYLEHRGLIMAAEVQEAQKNRLKTLEVIQRGEIPTGGLLLHIQLFGQDRFFAALEVLEQLTRNEDSEIRAAALKTLALYFGLPKYWDIASRFLLEDPDEECRVAGAEAFAYLQQDTGDTRTLALLATVVSDKDAAPPVRRTAYAALQAVRHYSPGDWYTILSPDYALDSQVDWEMVKSYQS